MLAILRAFIDIALLRQGPQHLPPSTVLLGLALGANALLHVVSAPLQKVGWVQVLIAFAVGTTMMMSVIWLLLNAIRRRERFVQCATAILGTDSLLVLAELVVVTLAPDATAALLAGNLSGASLLLLGIFAWQIAVISHILRQTMSVTILQSLGIIALIAVLYVGAISLIAPFLGLGAA
jgi:hypothetical protein